MTKSLSKARPSACAGSCNKPQQRYKIGGTYYGHFDTLQEESTFSRASGNNYHYVVLQVVLKEKFIGTGSGNLTELEKVINEQAAKGYRLHTISTTSSGSKGLMGGDRIQATMVFEKLE